MEVGGEGGHLGGSYFLNNMYLHISATVKQDMKVPPLSFIHMVWGVVSTNLGMWYRGEYLGGMAFVDHVRGIQYGYLMFGDK